MIFLVFFTSYIFQSIQSNSFDNKIHLSPLIMVKPPQIILLVYYWLELHLIVLDINIFSIESLNQTIL